jgi:hypothetical protein
MDGNVVGVSLNAEVAGYGAENRAEAIEGVHGTSAKSG